MFPTLQVLEDRMNLSSSSLAGAAAQHISPSYTTGPVTLKNPIVPGLKPPPPGNFGPMSRLASPTAITAPHPAPASHAATVAALHTVTLP